MNVLIIGVGNEYRGDDAAGILVAREIARDLSRNAPEDEARAIQVVEMSGEGTALMDRWKDARIVFLVDAVSSGAAPGTIYRLDAVEPVPSGFFSYSTHTFSVAEAVELARVMNLLPGRLVVYGIEGSQFGVGQDVTPHVEAAIRATVEKIREEVRLVGRS